jgi:hypothetical protein
MQKFDAHNLQTDITTFIRNWFKLLAYHNYEEAAQMLDQDSNDMEAPQLDRAFFEEILNTYYWEGYIEDKPTCFSDPYLLDLHSEIVEFYPHDDGLGLDVDYNPPINGVWSDLTAQFSIRKVNGDSYFVHFIDLHVL